MLKAFSFAEKPNFDGYQRRFASMVFRFFDKKNADTSSGAIKKDNIENQQLPEELRKPIIRKFKSIVYSSARDNIWSFIYAVNK